MFQRIEQERLGHLSNELLPEENVQQLKLSLVLFTTQKPPTVLPRHDTRAVSVARSSGKSRRVEMPERFQAATSPVRNNANQLVVTSPKADPQLEAMGVGQKFPVPANLCGSTPASLFRTQPDIKSEMLQRGQLKHRYLARRSTKSPNYKVSAALVKEKEKERRMDRLLRSTGTTYQRAINKLRCSTSAAANRRRYTDDCTGANAGVSSFKFTADRGLSP